jgi:putative restriction endonuclease
MTLQEIIEEIDQQPAWEANGVRAPHKPLTILYAMGQARAGRRIVRYSEASPALERLLEQFGPPRKDHHPEQPVWRLRQYRGVPTRFWQVEGPIDRAAGTGGNPLIRVMRESISFGLTEDASRLLFESPANAALLATSLAAKIVPPSMLDELLEAVGLNEFNSMQGDNPPILDSQAPELTQRMTRTASVLVRDSTFARKVRDAYQESCAICSVAPRLDRKLFGLEAAHIRWANAGGPDDVCNALFLCRMHHDALDRGAIRVDSAMRLELSPKLARNSQSDELFARFEGREIRLPKSATNHPHIDMLKWHWSEVFKG